MPTFIIAWFSLLGVPVVLYFIVFRVFRNSLRYGTVSVKLVCAIYFGAVFVVTTCLSPFTGSGQYKHGVSKPVIYLYPEKEQDVSVALLDPDRLTVSYPFYDGVWNVTAKPDGSLVDKTTGRSLYSLYYESETDVPVDVTDEGFCVNGADVVPFLEEKLSVLGLSDREAEEFIIYWLPRMQACPYVYVRFLTQEEIADNMGLKITPEPDTLIRVIMAWQGLDVPVEVEEQILNPVSRTGFTAVEWGATEIDNEFGILQ